MSRVTYLEPEQAQLDFVRAAADYFARHPKSYSYGGDLAPGELLALRWGLHERAVLVCKLDDLFDVVIYGDVVPEQEVAPSAPPEKPSRPLSQEDVAWHLEHEAPPEAPEERGEAASLADIFIRRLSNCPTEGIEDTAHDLLCERGISDIFAATEKTLRSVLECSLEELRETPSSAPSPAPGEGRGRYTVGNAGTALVGPNGWIAAECRVTGLAERIAAALNGEAEVAKLREEVETWKRCADQLAAENEELRADLEASRELARQRHAENDRLQEELADALRDQPAPLAPPPEGEPFRVVEGPSGCGLVAWTGEEVDGQLFTREHIGKRAALLNRLFAAARDAANAVLRPVLLRLYEQPARASRDGDSRFTVSDLRVAVESILAELPAPPAPEGEPTVVGMYNEDDHAGFMVTHWSNGSAEVHGPVVPVGEGDGERKLWATCPEPATANTVAAALEAWGLNEEAPAAPTGEPAELRAAAKAVWEEVDMVAGGRGGAPYCTGCGAEVEPDKPLVHAKGCAWPRLRAALDAAPPGERTEAEIKAYILGLPWSQQATEHEKTLVECNLWTFARWLRGQAQKPELDAAASPERASELAAPPPVVSEEVREKVAALKVCALELAALTGVCSWGPPPEQAAHRVEEAVRGLNSVLSAAPSTKTRPRIVCLCGSSRFREAHARVTMDETLAGHIVVGMGLFGHDDYPPGTKAATADGDESATVKQALDALHLRKIDLADEVLVLNVGGYIGNSTAREVAHALNTGKAVRWLEPLPRACDGHQQQECDERCAALAARAALAALDRQAGQQGGEGS